MHEFCRQSKVNRLESTRLRNPVPQEFTDEENITPAIDGYNQIDEFTYYPGERWLKGVTDD